MIFRFGLTFLGREITMQKRLCEHCGHELYQFDDYNNEGWHCPNNCDFEIGCKKYEERFPFELEVADMVECSNSTSDNLPNIASVKTTHCWYCKGTVIRLPQNQDPPYGHFCPICSHSLRFHPLLGQGKPMDQALRYSSRLTKNQSIKYLPSFP